LAHRLDESPADYSLAGWSPPEPASASPAASSMNQNRNAGYDLSANGNLSPYKLSQLWGAVQLTGAFARIASRARQAGQFATSSPVAPAAGQIRALDKSLHALYAAKYFPARIL